MNYYYFDPSGQKQGPIDDQQLQTLVSQRIITPESTLETENGHKEAAGQIPGLTFPETTLPEATPSEASPAETNPFTGPTLTESNPFTSPGLSSPSSTSDKNSWEAVKQKGTAFLRWLLPILKRGSEKTVEVTKKVAAQANDATKKAAPHVQEQLNKLSGGRKRLVVIAGALLSVFMGVVFLKPFLRPIGRAWLSQGGMSIYMYPLLAIGILLGVESAVQARFMLGHRRWHIAVIACAPLLALFGGWLEFRNMTGTANVIIITAILLFVSGVLWWIIEIVRGCLKFVPHVQEQLDKIPGGRKRLAVISGAVLLVLFGGWWMMDSNTAAIRENVRVDYRESVRTKNMKRYLEESHNDRLAEWIVAAKRGIPEGEYLYGWCFYLGIGEDQHYDKAVKWFRKAAGKGFAPAQDKLGMCSLKGEGVAKDESEAVKWFRKAARQGDAGGQCSLGRCYMEGEGVLKNEAEGLKWLRKSAEQEHGGAMMYLVLHYLGGDAAEDDPVEAVKWMRKGAEAGFMLAQHNMGIAYRIGKGVRKNEDEAFRWFRRAAEQDYADSQFMLGLCYLGGMGVAENEGEGVRWLRKAAGQGHKGARDFLREHF